MIIAMYRVSEKKCATCRWTVPASIGGMCVSKWRYLLKNKRCLHFEVALLTGKPDF